MEYYRDSLSFKKKTLKSKTFSIQKGKDFPKVDIDNDIINIVADHNYMVGLPDEVHRQISNIRGIGLTPKYVIMNIKTYEQMILYCHNLSGEYIPPTLFGLDPIVTPSFTHFQIEVQCSAYDEFMYREELSRARYAVREG